MTYLDDTSSIEIGVFDITLVKEFEGNPRYITRERFTKLSHLMLELGDCSGIIIDRNTNSFVGGNRRNEILGVNMEGARVEWAQEYDEPTATGTLKVGYIFDPRNGEPFNLRLVDWTREQCEIANLAANYAGGQTDFDKLFGQNNFNDDTFLKVFSKNQFDGMLNRSDFMSKFDEMEKELAQTKGQLKKVVSKNERDFDPDKPLYKGKNKELDLNELDNEDDIKMNFTFKLPSLLYWVVKYKLMEVSDSPEDALLKLLFPDGYEEELKQLQERNERKNESENNTELDGE